MLMFNGLFIAEHINELVRLEDYVPISFEDYDAQHKRDNFLSSKNLLTTINEMDLLINQKCQAHENPGKAMDSVVVEWLDCHPEFEGMISDESFGDYQKMKNDNDYIDFNDLLDFVELPSEKKEWVPPEINEDYSIKDDSSIQLPNFKAIDDIFDEYGATLLACYLSYLV